MVNRDSFGKRHRKELLERLTVAISSESQDSKEKGTNPEILKKVPLNKRSIPSGKGTLSKISSNSTSNQSPNSARRFSSDEGSTSVTSIQGYKINVFMLVLLFPFILAIAALGWNTIFSSPSVAEEFQVGSYVGPLLADSSDPWEETIGLALPNPQCALEDDYSKELAELKARSYAAYYSDSFEIVFGKNEQERVPFASITKLLSALTVLEEYNMETSIGLIEEVDAEGNGMDLVVGEKAQVRSLLAAALVGSRNDAMYALAQNHTNGVKGFVDHMMSIKERIGMEDTSVQNPIGLDNDLQYSTTRDVAILMIAVMKEPELRDILSRSEYVVRTSLGREERIWTTNALLGKVEGVVAGKTGYTGDAGLSLVEYVDAERDFVTVVFNAEDRYAESEILIGAVYGKRACTLSGNID